MTARDNRDGLATDKRNKALLVAGIDSSGHVRVIAIEEERYPGPAGGSGGIILAGHEQVQELLRSGFALIAGGRADADGELAAADQASDGAAQRVLVDEHGRVWVRLAAGDDVVNWVQEQAAIIGEDARHTPLQRLVVGKEITHPATLASALTASLVTVAYASLVTTEPIQIDRAKKVTVRVTYTPGENNARLLLYPQITLGEVAEVFGFVTAWSDALTPLNVAINPATNVRQSAGYYAEDPFYPFTTVAATPIVATFTLDDYPAMNALRFALRDTAQETAGTATIIVVQE